MRRRLALTVLSVTTMITIAFLLPLAVLVREVVEDRAVSAAEQEARSLAGVLAAVSDRDRTAELVAQLDAASPRRVAVLLADGSAIGEPVDLRASQRARAFDGEAFSVDVDGHHVVLVPVRNASGDVAVATVAVPSSQLHRGVLPAWLALAGLGVILVALGVVLADRLGRSTVRSMVDLEDVTRQLQRGDLDARATPAGPPEVEQVARAVNDLAAQIQHLLAAEREAAADLSHRLRTPLTALQLQFESVADPADRARLADSVQQLTEEVSAVINAARAPRPSTGSAPACDLVEVVDRRVRFWQVLARQQARAVSWSPPQVAASVATTEDDLVAALDALLSNVFQHTPPGTGFAVHVEPGADHHRLIVEDDGPGLPTDDVHRRGRSSAGSTGLGIDIAKQTAEHSGGSLALESSPSGGARVVVVLGATARPATT